MFRSDCRMPQAWEGLVSAHTGGLSRVPSQKRNLRTVICPARYRRFRMPKTSQPRRRDRLG